MNHVLVSSSSVLVEFRQLVLVGLGTQLDGLGVAANGVWELARLEELVALVLLLDRHLKLCL